MSWPNRLTLLRLVLIPPFLVAAYLSPAWALAIFVAASLTDWLDGHLARKWGLVTNFGKLMDPLADKVLVTAALIVLVDLGTVPAWSVVLILFREYLITGLRTLAAEHGRVVDAAQSGKIKTVLQMASISVLLLWPTEPGLWLYWAAVAVTAYSGIEYVWRLRGLLADA